MKILVLFECDANYIKELLERDKKSEGDIKIIERLQEQLEYGDLTSENKKLEVIKYIQSL